MTYSNITPWQAGDPLSPTVLNSKLTGIVSDLSIIEAAIAGISPAGSSVIIADTGTPIGSFGTISFSGASVTQGGGVATITVPSPSAVAFTQSYTTDQIILSSASVDLGSWLSVTASGITALLSGSSLLDSLLSRGVTPAPSNDLPTGVVAFYTADAGIAATDGSDVTVWQDQSGNGRHLVSQGTYTTPLWYADPDGDGMPLVRFDGADNTLGIGSLSTYTGTDLTLFLVSRSVSTTATKKIASVYGVGQFGTDGDESNSAMAIHAEDPQGLSAKRVGVFYAGGASSVAPAGQSAMNNGVSEWALFLIRWASILSRGVATVRNNTIACSFDLGSSNTNWNYTNYTLGSGSIGGISWPNNVQCDIRAFGVYDRALLDSEIRALLRALGSHWQIAGLL